jgi:hypothetical protein
MMPAKLNPALFPRCPYCGHDFESRGGRTIDHLVPKSRGGSNAAANLVTACARCNVDKADMLLTEFYGWLLACNDRRCRLLFAALMQAADGDPRILARIAIEGARGYRRYATCRHTAGTDQLSVLRRASGQRVQSVPAWVPRDRIAAYRDL